MPSHYTQAILKAVKTPEQLREIELNSDDDIYDQTAEHWQRFIKLRFSRLSAQHNFAPSNRKSWHKVYEHYRQLDAEELAASTQLLQQQLDKQQASVRHSGIISAAESEKLRPGKPKRGSGPPREKPQSFLQKAKQQVRLEASRFKLRTPTGQLPVAAGQIKQAPEAIANEVRIRNQPTLIRAPSKKPTPTSRAADHDREEKEARLRRIKSGTKPMPGAGQKLLSFSDDDNDAEDAAPAASRAEAEDDLFGDSVLGVADDLFGDRAADKTPTPAASSPVPAPAKGRPAPLAAPAPPPRPSAKRRGTDVDDDGEQPAKHRRTALGSAPSASSASSRPPPPPPPPAPARKAPLLVAIKGAPYVRQQDRPAAPGSKKTA